MTKENSILLAIINKILTLNISKIAFLMLMNNNSNTYKEIL